MIDARDIDISSGVNKVSVDDELKREVFSSHLEDVRKNAPHANEVLHHEFMESFGRVGHVHLSLAIPEVRLERYEPQSHRDAFAADLLHNVREGGCMIQVEATQILESVAARAHVKHTE